MFTRGGHCYTSTCTTGCFDVVGTMLAGKLRILRPLSAMKRSASAHLQLATNLLIAPRERADTRKQTEHE